MHANAVPPPSSSHALLAPPRPFATQHAIARALLLPALHALPALLDVALPILQALAWSTAGASATDGDPHGRSRLCGVISFCQSDHFGALLARMASCALAALLLSSSPFPRTLLWFAVAPPASAAALLLRSCPMPPAAAE
eukprot:1477287-Amphidinium_carterae.1